MKSKNPRLPISLVLGAFVIALILLALGAVPPQPLYRNKWSTNTTGQAWHDFYVDAGAMRPSTNEPSIGASTNGLAAIVIDTWDFDDTVEESVQFKLTMPDIWRGNGYINMKLYATTEEASGTWRWLVQAGSASHDDPIGVSLSTAYYWTNTVTAADDLLVSSGKNLGVAGAPVLGDMLFFKITRDLGLWDTVAGDVKLMGVTIQYQEDEDPWAEW